MKLWLLKRREDLLPGHDPWSPWFDKNLGLVVRAETEQRAREIAEDAGADESRDADKPWMDAACSTCNELHASGEEGVVIIDHAAA
jgi:hypothetical protein